MNNLVLTGRWSKEIDFKALDSGKTLSKTSLAFEDGYGDNKKTYFIDIEMWGKLAESVANHSGKGRKVLVKGRLKIESWETDGNKRYKPVVVVEEVEFLDYKDKEESQQQQNSTDPFKDDGTPISISEDDLPF